MSFSFETLEIPKAAWACRVQFANADGPRANHVATDAPDIDVVFAGEPDPLTPLGVKGVGEIGLVGIAAAIANGVHHATGRRIRSIPITLDRLL